MNSALPGFHPFSLARRSLIGGNDRVGQVERTCAKASALCTGIATFVGPVSTERLHSARKFTCISVCRLREDEQGIWHSRLHLPRTGYSQAITACCARACRARCARSKRAEIPRASSQSAGAVHPGTRRRLAEITMNGGTGTGATACSRPAPRCGLAHRPKIDIPCTRLDNRTFEDANRALADVFGFM